MFVTETEAYLLWLSYLPEKMLLLEVLAIFCMAWLLLMLSDPLSSIVTAASPRGLLILGLRPLARYVLDEACPLNSVAGLSRE